MRTGTIDMLYKMEREDYMWLEFANFTSNHEQFYYFLSLFY